MRSTHLPQLLWRKLLFIGLLVIIFLITFFYLWPMYGERLSILVSIPVLGCAWLLGFRAGLMAWAMSIPSLVLLFRSAGGTVNLLDLHATVIGLGMLLIAVLAVGRLHNLSQRLTDELAERRKLEMALRESQLFSQKVTDTIPDLVYIYDRNEGRNVYVNRSIGTILGYTPERVAEMGSSIIETLAHPDDLAGLREKIAQESARMTQPFHYEYRLQRANGEWCWLQSREVILSRNPDGTPHQVLGIAHDITEQKKADEALLEQEKLRVALRTEQELVSLKSRLMITISHEFRTPLTIALASAELLERYFDRLSAARRAEALTSIKTQILHMREMLNDIGALIAQEATKPIFRPAPVDLVALCQQVTDEIRASVGASTPLSFSADGDLSSVMVDIDLLHPVLRNLLTNAVKYSPAGSPVSLRASRQGDEVTLVVSDQGIGIPPDDQEHVFETFHRASNVTHIGGLGLGLKIVRDYVTLHGGTISVRSQEGQGSMFIVRLPVSYEQPQPAAAPGFGINS